MRRHLARVLRRAAHRLDPFLPSGASDLANNSWITRIADGLAGASPALLNVGARVIQRRPWWKFWARR